MSPPLTVHDFRGEPFGFCLAFLVASLYAVFFGRRDYDDCVGLYMVGVREFRTVLLVDVHPEFLLPVVFLCHCGEEPVTPNRIGNNCFCFNMRGGSCLCRLWGRWRFLDEPFATQRYP